MESTRYDHLIRNYAGLRVGVLGDFCLDQYFEIDPEKEEISIETGLPVHNITRIRRQPGASGTILNNLVALGVGEIYPIGFTGKDAEGWALRQALQESAGVCLDYFVDTPERSTFTYTKPLLMHSDQPPEELSRLDIKNWEATPDNLSGQWISALEKLILGDGIDALIVMDQVDIAGTGVITRPVLRALNETLATRRRGGTFWALADSRQGLAGFPKGLTFKMNHHELARMMGRGESDPDPARSMDMAWVGETAVALATQHGSPVIVSCAESGIQAATPEGECVQRPAHALRGPIDIVGAGDSVTANLTAALASGAALGEALEIAMAAASLVIHQLGDTGVASTDQIRGLLFDSSSVE